MLNQVSCFNKICRLCCVVNYHMHMLKVWLNSVLPLLIYGIFSSSGIFYWCTLYIQTP